MDGRRFRTEPWSGEYENPEGVSGRWTVVFGEAISFGDLFLWASKEKVTRPRQRTKTDAFPQNPIARGDKRSY